MATSPSPPLASFARFVSRSALACLTASCGGAAAPPAAPPPSSTASARPSPTVAPTATPAPDLGALLDPLFAAYAKPDVAGCGVGVYRAGELVFSRGYGRASLENDVGIDADTVFEIGSVSKQFTAMAVLLLAEDGKLSLEDDVRKYLPELRDYGRPLRIHHLLHHTSGLRDLSDLLVLGGVRDSDWTTDFDALAAIARQKGLDFLPGTGANYSNSAYFLLSLLVKRVSGDSLAELSQKRIFEPLGMKSTLIIDDRTKMIRNHASSYAPHAGSDAASPRFDVVLNGWNLTGYVGVATTLRDLARWDGNFYRPTVGNAHVLSLLRTPGTLDSGAPIPWAAGLRVTSDGGLLREEHNGHIGGFHSFLVRFPTSRLTVATLCNVDGANADALGESVAEALLPEVARQAREASEAKQATATASTAPQATAAPSFSVPPKTLEEYTGRFASDEVLSDWVATVGANGLELRPFGREQTDPPWTPGARDHFTLGECALEFHRDAKGRVQSFKLTMPDSALSKVFTFIRVSAPVRR